MARYILGEFEQAVLLAVLRLGSEAYGVPIRRHLNERLKRDVSVGALYTTLGRLEGKGFVSSWMGGATPQRGHRAKRYYKIKAPGICALNEAREARDAAASLWDVPEGALA
jgi:PadR family transcriptional regulator, regulatory protein PadR